MDLRLSSGFFVKSAKYFYYAFNMYRESSIEFFVKNKFCSVLFSPDKIEFDIRARPDKNMLKKQVSKQ